MSYTINSLLSLAMPDAMFNELYFFLVTSSVGNTYFSPEEKEQNTSLNVKERNLTPIPDTIVIHVVSTLIYGQNA